MDDHFVVRSGLAASFEAEEDLKVVAQADSVAEGKATLAAEQPSVAVIDLRLPDGSGIEIVREARASASATRCLILSANAVENEVLESVEAGAAGFLSKTAERDELLDAIRVIAGGSTYFPVSIRRIMDRAGARPSLSPQEDKVLARIVAGRSNKEIAAEMGLAEITIRQHVSRILKKLEVQDRTQAAVTAVHRGIVQLPEE